MNSIGERINALIFELRLSKNAFARELNTSSSRISNITTGRNKPDSDLLAAIVTVFTDVNPRWLLTGEGEMFEGKTPFASAGNLPVRQSFYSAEESQTNQKPTPVYQIPSVTNDYADIPITNVRAAAGGGLINDEYMNEAEVIQMPMSLVKKGEKYLCVAIKGVSMAPTLQDGGFLIVRLVERENWKNIKDERIHVVVNTDGETYVKRVKNRLSDETGGFVVLRSDNPDHTSYPSITVYHEHIHTIWYAEWYLSPKMPNIHDQFYTRLKRLEDGMELMAQEMADMGRRLK